MMDLPFTKMEKASAGVAAGWCGERGGDLELAVSDASRRRPGGDVEQAGGEVRDVGAHFGVFGIQMVFKVRKLDAIA